MNDRYKVTISNKNIYKEIELSSSINQLRIGTNSNCDVRLRKDMYFDEIELIFQRNNDKWNVFCSDNIYLNLGDARKLITKVLDHGDELYVKYQNSDYDVFSLSFMLDFDYKTKNYERVIDLSSVQALSIGTTNDCNIIINSQFLNNDKITLDLNTNQLKVISTQYGVYLNGRKIDNECKIHNRDFISIADFSFYYKDKKLWTEIEDNIKCVGLNYQDNKIKNNYPKFNRNTRIKHVVDIEPILILDPPSIPKKPKGNLVSKLLPSVVMIIVGFAMISVSPFMLVSSGVGIITAIISLIQDKKEFKNNSEERVTKYNNYINEKKEDITLARINEKEILESIYLNLDKEIQLLNEFSSDLFDRRRQDEDFLCINLGIGDISTLKPVTYKKQEKLEVEDELQKIPEQINQEYKYIYNGPVICDLKKINALGVIGKKRDYLYILKEMVIDIISRQFYKDVEIFFISSMDDIELLHTLRLLPQVKNESTGLRNIVSDSESKTIVFEYLYKELNSRANQKEKQENKNIIVFVIDDDSFKNHPISKFIDIGNEIGVNFIFFSSYKQNITVGCDYFVNIIDEQYAELIDTTGTNSLQKFKYSLIDDNLFKKVISFVAPVYTEEVSLEGTLTKNISLFKMLNILSVDDINLENNWTTSQVYKTMAAPIGVSKSGIINLDLHDKAHGPHGLVAGTTGSGKSEILQTYILSMSILYHPYEVGFVIIDFKGGGMVNQFRNLPHLIGAITNIDGREIDRSLKSIKAELQKRQRLFAEAEVNHIDKYIKKYKAGEVTIPLPHLILIVDEFAELKAEQPEFMKELISAARIGRSLGVHLILATQKPSGQVNEQIWSNSRFKLCLKVQDQSDSNEVLKSPLAAEIKEPGRAYLQVGNNEIFELFQSAYSGAPEKSDTISVKEFDICEVNEYGKRTQVFSQRNKKSDENISQLDAIVRYIDSFCKNEKINKLQEICLPSLNDKIAYQNNRLKDGKLSLGIYDDPDNQYQGDMYINLNNNLLVIGASQTGKTNLMQLIIRNLASYKTPHEVSFYIIDFGSMILKNFESLNHVGGVVTSSEEEKLKNLFKLLISEIDIRKEKLLSIGVSSFSSFIDAGYTDFSQIYVMMDNFPVFKELYSEKYEEELFYLLREGVTYGISFIFTSPTTSGLGYKYLSSFGEHLAFTCNDSGEYSNIFDRCRVEPKNVAGRALVSINKNIYEMQTYIAFDGEKEIDRVNSMKEFIKECNANNMDCYAKRIPEVQSELTMNYLENNYKLKIANEIVTSLSYQTVEPISINLTSTPQLALIGKNKNSMILFVNSILENIKRYYFERNSEVYIIDSFKRDFKNYENEGYINQYIVDYTSLDKIFESLQLQLEERYNRVIENGIEYINNMSFILIIINSSDAIDYISKSKQLMEMYNTFNTKYKEMKFTFLFTGIDDVNIGYSASDLYKKIKESKNAYIFTNLQEHKVFDIPISFMRQNKKQLEITQGYYLKESEINKIRFVTEVK